MIDGTSALALDPVIEPHLTPKQLAEAWGVSVEYVRRRFRYEPGVTMFGRAMRIPRSVAERVHRQAGQRAQQGPVRFARFRMKTTKDGKMERVLVGRR